MNPATFDASSEVKTEISDVFGNRVVWIYTTFHTNSNWDLVSVQDTATIMLHIDFTVVLLNREGTILCIGTKLSVFFQRWIL